MKEKDTSVGIDLDNKNSPLFEELGIQEVSGNVSSIDTPKDIHNKDIHNKDIHNNNYNGTNNNGNQKPMFGKNQIKLFVITAVVILIAIMSILVVLMNANDVETEIESSVPIMSCDVALDYDDYFTCIALVDNDIDLCSDDEDITDIGHCKLAYSFYQGLINSEISECDKVQDGDYKTLCRAIALDDSIICNNIVSTEEAEICRSIINQDIALCKDKIPCQVMHNLIIGIRSSDVNQCDLIEDQASKAFCQAIVSSDNQKCYEIKELCFEDTVIMAAG